MSRTGRLFESKITKIVASMMVRDVGDRMCWLQVLNVGDRSRGKHREPGINIVEYRDTLFGPPLSLSSKWMVIRFKFDMLWPFSWSLKANFQKIKRTRTNVFGSFEVDEDIFKKAEIRSSWVRFRDDYWYSPYYGLRSTTERSSQLCLTMSSLCLLTELFSRTIVDLVQSDFKSKKTLHLTVVHWAITGLTNGLRQLRKLTANTHFYRRKNSNRSGHCEYQWTKYSI